MEAIEGHVVTGVGILIGAQQCDVEAPRSNLEYPISSIPTDGFGSHIYY